MPLYEYQCRPHSHRFEVRHGINEQPITSCPECGGEVRRVIHPVGVVFKGSGFYVTDSRKSSEKAPAKKSETKSSESKSSESKSEGSSSTSSESKSSPSSESAAAS